MNPPPKPSSNGLDETVETRVAAAKVAPSVDVVANASYRTSFGSRRRSSQVTPTRPWRLTFTHGKNWSVLTLLSTDTGALQVPPPSVEVDDWSRRMPPVNE